MRIEDRLDRLERIVIRAHEQAGHVWFQGDDLSRFTIREWRKQCFCGHDEKCTQKEWKTLPVRDWPDPDRDRY